MSVKKTFNAIGNIIFYMIIVFLIVICIVMALSKIKGEQTSLFGYKIFSVLTGSMSPTIEVGDLIIVKEVSSEDIKANDIITFGSNKSDTRTTHRVKEILKDDEIKFVTKGDANNTTDPAPISEDLLVGKVTNWIPKVGLAIEAIKNNMTIVVIGIIVLIGLYIMLCVDFRKLISKSTDSK